LIVAWESIANSNSSKIPAIATVQVFDGFLEPLNVGHGESLAGTFISNPCWAITANETGAGYNATGGKESNGKISGKPKDDVIEKKDY